MKEIVDKLREKGLIYKKLIMIDNKLLKTRKKIAIYEAVDFERYYTAIFELKQKSRFLRKDVEVLEMLYARLKVLQDHNFKKKILLYDMPFCSKAQMKMKEDGWRLIDVSH
jgi:hypothetical protein